MGIFMHRNIYKIILAVSLVLIIVSTVNIIILSREYQAGINEYKALEKYVEIVDDSKPAQEDREETQEEIKESVIPVSLEINFTQLKTINEDIVGWLYYEPLDLSYPIVRGNDNEYYTLYTFEKEKNSSGAIFMDFLNRPNFQDFNTIIYGHNFTHIFSCITIWLFKKAFER